MDYFAEPFRCSAFWESQIKKYQCIVCGWIYDEAEGWPQDGIVAGTNGTIYLTIGLAQIVACQKSILKWLKSNS